MRRAEPMGRPIIYMDHGATTPLRPEVRAAMAAVDQSAWGNPGSIHAAGRVARDAVEKARIDVASLLGCLPEEIVFTSGGTEGDNLAIRGLAQQARARARRSHIVSSPIEHPAVLGALAALRREGFTVTTLPVGARGEIAAEALADALSDATALVTLATANHEIGNCFPIAELAAIARARGALFHTDAVQAAGKMALAAVIAGVDAATVSAHKIHGPKGVGALFVRRGVELGPLIAGGPQERGRRAGTENVAGIVGFGVACRLAAAELAEVSARMARLRDRLESRLCAIPGARVHGTPSNRVASVTNVGFAGVDGQLALVSLDLEGVCVSTGAACASGSLEPSAVLLALGSSPGAAREGLRLSLGRDNTEDEVDRVAALMTDIVARIRSAGDDEK